MVRRDPGPCPICDAPLCSCGGGPILVEQLPATASARAAIPAPMPEPMAAERVQATLPPDQTTSGTYRGAKKR